MKRAHHTARMTPERAVRAPTLEHGTGVSRRRALTIVAAAAGMPLLCGADRSHSAPLLHQWTGTSLGSPSQLLLYHGDGATAARIARECAAEIERLERIFALYRADSEIARANRNGRLDFRRSICSRCFAMPSLVRAQRRRLRCDRATVMDAHAAHFSAMTRRRLKGRRCR
jgi:thiamine biosynthesis lipoprotein